LGISWHTVIKNELWKTTGAKPIVLKIRENGDESVTGREIYLFENKYWIGIRRKPEGEENRSKPEKKNRLGGSRKMRRNMGRG
jgi:hypothetical protein